jgi:hypothetical protein
MSEEKERPESSRSNAALDLTPSEKSELAKEKT